MQHKGDQHSAPFKHAFDEISHKLSRSEPAPGWENLNFDPSRCTEKHTHRSPFSMNSDNGPIKSIFFPCEDCSGAEGLKGGGEVQGGAAPGRYSDNAGEGIDVVEYFPLICSPSSPGGARNSVCMLVYGVLFRNEDSRTLSQGWLSRKY